MTTRTINTICGVLGFLLVAVFVIGLAHSISTGFAGFKGGLPFAIIVALVLSMAAYDIYDSCIRKKPD